MVLFPAPEGPSIAIETGLWSCMDDASCFSDTGSSPGTIQRRFRASSPSAISSREKSAASSSSSDSS